jgi:hypothetical protein
MPENKKSEVGLKEVHQSPKKIIPLMDKQPEVSINLHKPQRLTIFSHSRTNQLHK